VTAPPTGGRAVVLYDGHCRFCTRSAGRLVRVVGATRLETRSFQVTGVLDAFPGLTHEECMTALHLVELDGQVWAGAAGIARALALRPVVRPFGQAYFLPGMHQVADAVYRLTARNRYRIPGRADDCDPDGTCHLH
jgi:predicted DCC family thiol-disulfide oxidoreductase YuxK